MENIELIVVFGVIAVIGYLLDRAGVPQTNDIQINDSYDLMNPTSPLNDD